ncbi:MAG: magnesium transporter [Ignavibacteriaceae bacterium]|nr:magnesium transporter [Ignavibacterium sp.]MCC6253678.1 magnesium transporter [Ignavibacteriaceae bacterium]HMN25166.1 magnesium transporter [Ignavibacteriaceae bacterium]HRN26011.1 magnesium transporter [Ignavibacteriaceae bacterium]HRP91345.1 magnesium transporter [Ignavibacteriaceae bacterium]
MLSRLLQPEIQSLIEERQLGILKEILLDWTPADIAELLVDLPEKDRVIIFRLLSKELAADTFEYMDFDTQMELLKLMGKEESAVILNEMDPDDRTALFEELPSAAAKQLIQLLSPDERKIAVTLLGYPENSVGRLMTPDYIAIKPSFTIQQTLDFIRENGKNKETLNIVYVIDDNGKLIDDVKIKDFLLAPLDSKVEDLMEENFVALHVFDDQEIAVEAFKKYDRVALPVVDRAGMLIGIVTVDDVFDVAEEEATEDIHKLAAIQVLEDSYSTIPLFEMIKKRGSWLAVLFVGEMFTTTALGFFEDEMRRAIVLTLFIPLIISSGGNSGSQAATLVIRALSLGEVTLRDWYMIFKRELYTGLALGAILASIGFLRITIWEVTSDIYGEHWFLIGATVSLSLISVVLWGTISGSMLPFILKKFGLDPATSSAPLVATMVDVFGIVIYFSIALFLLSGTLL